MCVGVFVCLCVYVFLMAVIHLYLKHNVTCCDVRYQAVAYIEASAYIYQDGKVRLNSRRLLCAEIHVLG